MSVRLSQAGGALVLNHLFMIDVFLARVTIEPPAQLLGNQSLFADWIMDIDLICDHLIKMSLMLEISEYEYCT